MPLERKKLEKVVDLADGMIRARCPACAEKGQDKKGEHLRIYPDGRFGCCVFPRDREHRKRIFALAGERGRQAIKVRVAAAKAPGPVQTGILGRLGRRFQSPASNPVAWDAWDGVGEVETQSLEAGTLGTGKTKSNGDAPPAADDLGTLGTGSAKSKPGSAMEVDLPWGELGTLGTPSSNSRVYSKKDQLVEDVHVRTLKEFREGVPSVPSGERAEQPPTAAGKPGRMPYLTPGGTLGIPFDAPERFFWWKLDGERQSVAQTMAEVRSWMVADRKEEHETGV